MYIFGQTVGIGHTAMNVRLSSQSTSFFFHRVNLFELKFDKMQDERGSAARETTAQFHAISELHHVILKLDSRL